MKRLLASIVMTASAAGLAAVVHAEEGGAKAAIEEQSAKFEQAFNSGDAATVASLYTEDAAILPPGSARIDGREAIQDFWAGAIEAGLADLDIQTVEVHDGDGMAVDVGTLALTAPAADGDGRSDLDANYIVLWQQGEDGVWRLHRDIWNVSQ